MDLAATLRSKPSRRDLPPPEVRVDPSELAATAPWAGSRPEPMVEQPPTPAPVPVVSQPIEPVQQPWPASVQAQAPAQERAHEPPMAPTPPAPPVNAAPTPPPPTAGLVRWVPPGVDAASVEAVRSSPQSPAAQPPSPPAKAPVWKLGAVIMAVVGAGAAVVAVLLVQTIFDLSNVSEAPAAGSSTAAVSAAASAPAPEAPQETLLDRAARGDDKAMAALQKQPLDDRTLEHAMALARGEQARKHAALQALATKARSDLPLSADQDTLRQLRKFAEDPDTSLAALEALAKLQVPMSADMLYDIATSSSTRRGTAELAEALALSKDTRQAASPALRVMLDLRRAQGCSDVKAALEGVNKSGDARALPLLEKLQSRTGCGTSKNQDCYACLRGDDTLKNAMAAVRERRAPQI